LRSMAFVVRAGRSGWQRSKKHAPFTPGGLPDRLPEVSHRVRCLRRAMGRVATPLVVCAALAAGILESCASDEGPTPSRADGGPPPGPTTCGGLSAPSDACAACETTSCCDFATSCAADPSCAAIEKCLGDCAGDLDCRAQCGANGVPTAWPALSVCQANQCADACGVSCESVVLQNAECTTCAHSACCSEISSCIRDLDCSELLACAENCTDFQCQSDCFVQHPGGFEKFNTLADCTQGVDCGEVCRYSDLSCVGTVQWPGVAGGKYGLSFTLSDAQKGTPLADVRMLACSRAAVECTPESALAGAVSDANGEVGVLVQGSEIAWVRIDGPGDDLPALIFFRPHVVDTTVIGAWLYPLSAAIQQMSPAATIDPTTAQLHAFIQDCGGRPLAGVRAEVEVLGKPQTVVYTRADQTPDPKLTATGFSGEIRVLNIPVTEADGFPLADITVFDRTDAKIAHTSVRLHAGYWSELWALGPTPAGE
jgi:hypothetical protein